MRSFSFSPAIAQACSKGMQKIFLFFKKMIAAMRSRFELSCWIAALFLIFFMDTNGHSLCVFSWLGFGPCPGCGLGHAIHSALHLEIARSFNEHPFGIPAVFILGYRIVQLSSVSKLNLQHDKQ